jgi:PEP-CTERM motif
MQKVLPAIAALGVAVAMSSLARANIVYTIDQTSTTPEVSGELSPLSDTIIGTITTDGTIGALQSSDIVSYNLQINDNIRPSYDVDLTPANSGIVEDVGDGLTASAKTLSFDFSDAGAVFAIQGTTHGFFSGYQYFCLQATSGPCVAGETIVPDYFAVDGVSATGLSGSVPLTGVPEPATWAMMLLGLAGLGAVMRSRRRITTASA